MLEKETVKEALTELLGEFPAFQALMKGKGPARAGEEVAAPAPPRGNSGPAEAGSSSEPPPPPRGRGGEERSAWL